MPPLTVASFATITHSWPSTTPTPVTMPGGGRLAVVDVPGRQRAQLEEGGARVDEPVDPLARGQLPARAVPLDGALAAPGRHLRGALAQLRDQLFHLRTTPFVGLGGPVDLRAQHRHADQTNRQAGPQVLFTMRLILDHSAKRRGFQASPCGR